MNNTQVCFWEHKDKNKPINFLNKRLIIQKNKNKITRKEATDNIKQFIEYAESNGSKCAKTYYITFSRLANKYAKITTKKYPNEFDCLKKLSILEQVISNEIQNNIKKNIEYHKIYDNVKWAVEVVSRYI